MAKIAEASRDEERQLGELLREAAYTGLRRGELIALRWRDIRWSERVLIVERDSPEPSSAPRRVDASATSLSPTSPWLGSTGLRGGPTSRAVTTTCFCMGAGDRLDPSALRRRYVAARHSAALPRLRFHDLRHTAGTSSLACSFPSRSRTYLVTRTSRPASDICTLSARQGLPTPPPARSRRKWPRRPAEAHDVQQPSRTRPATQL
jgi:integrase